MDLDHLGIDVAEWILLGVSFLLVRILRSAIASNVANDDKSFPETSANNILYRRTRRLRKLTGNERLKCEPELMGETMTGKEIVLMILVRPITLNFW